MKLVAVVTALALLVVTGTALAATLYPLTSGWEFYFKLEWQGGDRNGNPVVYGKILNDWGMAATNIRLLVDSLDDKGEITDQRVAWLGSQLTPGMRAYFEVRVPAAAPSYRVSVFAFDWIQMGGPTDFR